MKMDEKIYEGREFRNTDFSNQTLTGIAFEDCRFINCDFSGANLSNSDFIGCRFEACNLALTKLGNTGLKEVQFLQCKLIGLQFDHCNDFLFSVKFEQCQLDYAVFHQKKLKGTLFSHCSMRECDLTEADLASAIFDRCDLADAQFLRTDLRKADLRSALNYTIDPEQNRIAKALFSYPEVAGLLRKYDIRIE